MSQVTMSHEEMQAEIVRLQSENAKLKAVKVNNGFKITEKGGLSVYGLGRFPVTLYKSQWIKLLDMAETIREFIGQNEAKLSEKAKTETVSDSEIKSA